MEVWWAGPGGAPEQGNRLPQALGEVRFWNPLCPLLTFQLLTPKVEGLTVNPRPYMGSGVPIRGWYGQMRGCRWGAEPP